MSPRPRTPQPTARQPQGSRRRNPAVWALLPFLHFGCSMTDAATQDCAGAACAPPTMARADEPAEPLSPQAAASAGLAHLLAAIPAEQRHAFGFTGPEAFARAQLETPYEVWTSDAAEAALVGTGEWRFPVTVDGVSVALLTVARVEGRWQAVNLGAATLAHELHVLERDRAVAATARRALVRLPALRADLAAFPRGDEAVANAALEPLASAQAIAGAPRTPVAVASLLSWVRARRVAPASTR